MNIFKKIHTLVSTNMAKQKRNAAANTTWVTDTKKKKLTAGYCLFSLPIYTFLQFSQTIVVVIICMHMSVEFGLGMRKGLYMCCSEENT